MHRASRARGASAAWRPWQQAAAALALLTATVGHAATTTLSFDTDTTSNAQTLAVYGLQVDGGNGLAANGLFQLQITTVNRVTADFGSFAGNVRLDVDLVFTGLGGSMGMGFRIGDNYLLFHPGYAGGAFRVDGPGGTNNTEMGFTPTQAAMNHMSIDVNAATARMAVTIVDGLDAAKRFSYLFDDANYSAGNTVFGLEVNGQGTGYFDNLVIQTPVPEPASAALWGLGLAALAARAARARQTFRRCWPRQGMAGAAALLACVCLAAPVSAGASAVYLYEESVSGDLGPSTFFGGTPPVFNVGPFGGLVVGTLSAGTDRFGNFATDVDAFRFVVDEGYQLVGIDVTYFAAGTRGNVPLPDVQNVLFFGANANEGAVAEYFLPSNGTGAETLFDVAQPFQPIAHRAGPSQMIMQVADTSAPPDTGFFYGYTLRLTVQPAAAAAVPEPGSLGLVAAATACWAWSSRRGRRWRRR